MIRVEVWRRPRARGIRRAVARGLDSATAQQLFNLEYSTIGCAEPDLFRLLFFDALARQNMCDLGYSPLKTN